MSTQQTKRRRKRYQPGSAFAGDVKPRGVFRIFGNVRLFFLVGALIMVGSLFVGGIVRSGSLLGNNNSSKNTNYVLPTGTASATDATALPTLAPKHYTSAPAMTIDPSKKYTATIKLANGEGDIQVDLFAAQVPQTVNSFVFLANDGFYNGLTFYQVIADPHYVQAGDPDCQAGQAGDTCRGSGDPGYSISPEKPATPIPYDAGTLGMSNASQFFIALGSSGAFSNFTPLGKITSGLDVAEKITRGTPIESVTITAQ
jgi:peptidyl-prolyl cis-trans isomerase B (cyclophilin B)